MALALSRRLFVVVALASFLGGCGMEAIDDGRRARGDQPDLMPVVEAQADQFACPAYLLATADKPGGACLKPLDGSMTCPDCKVAYRKPGEKEDALNDPAAIAEEVKREAEAPMRKSVDQLKEELKKAAEELKIDPSKVDQIADADKLIESLKNDKDASGKSPLDRMAENERLRWDAEKRRLQAVDAKRDIAFLKVGAKPVAAPLFICPNADCKQSIDPTSNKCRTCKQAYVITPVDGGLTVKEPYEAICPSCKKAVDPFTSLCKGCDKNYRAGMVVEGVCWRCGGSRYCPECAGSGNTISAPGVGHSVCWACAPASAQGDQTTARGDGFCAECRGKGFLEYDPALPRDWAPMGPGRQKWQLKSGEPTSDKPEKE